MQVYPLNEQLEDTGLFGREEFIPDLVELADCVPDLAFTDVTPLFVDGAPDLDDLGCLEKDADLVENNALNLGRFQYPFEFAFVSNLKKQG